MRKVIAAINMSLDGFCDHDLLLPDEVVHDHYTALLKSGGVILYGSTTFRLMKYWQEILEKPSAEPSMNSFAQAIDQIPKLVFSHKLQDTGWATATLAQQTLEATVTDLKQQSGKDILVGSRSLILQLMQLNLVDEYQICVHPLLVGGGLPLFEHKNDRKVFQLVNTKTFSSEDIILYYKMREQAS